MKDVHVDTNPAKEVCKGIINQDPHYTVKPGDNLDVELEGHSDHGGGGCVFGISDKIDGQYKVLLKTDDSCPKIKEWTVPIPENSPSCEKCVFAWGWVPKFSGAPEYYMNCAYITIEGGKNDGSFNNLEDMKFYNMHGFETLHNNDGHGSETKST
jgi:hypothetical protein